MGTFYSHFSSHLSWKDFIYQEIETETCKIVHYSKKGSVAYLACKVNEEVFGLVLHCTTMNGDKGYKPVEESCGPYACEASLALLNKLTPTISENANEWREKCRQNAINKKNQIKLKEGDKVQFVYPIQWQGKSETDFRVIRLTGVRGLVFDSLNGKGMVRIRKANDKDKVLI